MHDQRRDLYRLDQEALRAHGARATRQDNLALWRAQIRGDPEGAVAIWERVMGVKATAHQRDELVRRTDQLASGWLLAQRAGLCPPSDLNFDESFVLTVFGNLPTVFGNLPDDVKRDRKALGRVLNAWNDASRPPSSLTCTAAVCGGGLGELGS